MAKISYSSVCLIYVVLTHIISPQLRHYWLNYLRFTMPEKQLLDCGTVLVGFHKSFDISTLHKLKRSIKLKVPNSARGLRLCRNGSSGYSKLGRRSAEVLHIYHWKQHYSRILSLCKVKRRIKLKYPKWAGRPRLCRNVQKAEMPIPNWADVPKKCWH